MKLKNTQLSAFIDNIKLKSENMSKYRVQIKNLEDSLASKIRDDKRTGLKVTRFIISGSWAKHTILRPTGDTPIDIDLVLFIQDDGNLKKDTTKLHDFIVQYLEEIYPNKDISKDVDAEGHTKSVKLKFVGTGLEVDIVPVVPLSQPETYVWQPERGGSGTYTTSIDKQLSFAQDRRDSNSNYTKIVRAIKWWRNYKELKPEDGESGLSSFAIELIVAYLDINYGVETDIEEGIIRFFQFISGPEFPIITFNGAINKVPSFVTPIFVADNTNNENNSAKKINAECWKDIINETSDAFDSLNAAESKTSECETIAEWKRVFGPSFKIN